MFVVHPIEDLEKKLLMCMQGILTHYVVVQERNLITHYSAGKEYN